MAWNPYFPQKENTINLQNAIISELNKQKNKENTSKTITKYKKNGKQASCIQMNMPSCSTFTKISAKPNFKIENKVSTPKDLRGSAVWQKIDNIKDKSQNNEQMTFESFLKDQNVQSRNNSIDQKKYKKNTRQYSHVVQGNAYYMPQQTISQYSTTDKQQQTSQISQISQISCNSGRDNQQLSDRTIKKKELTSLIKYKKNTRCISMGNQNCNLPINLECDEKLNIIQKEQYENEFTQETVQQLMLSEINYAPDPNYLNRQPQLTMFMRSVLFDWMMEVCTEFKLKRETYYLAMSYVDKYLSIKETTKHELQLLGTASLFIASKYEEIYPPKLEDFSKATGFSYNSTQIIDMELRIYKVLKYRFSPPTVNLWLNYFTNQWDEYVSENNQKFKALNERSYIILRTLQSYIDCAYLDAQTLQFKSRCVLAGFMYLVLGVDNQQFSIDYVKEVIPYSNEFLIQDQQKPFNQIFGDFVQYTFGFNLVDLLPIIQYCSYYFNLELQYTIPNFLDPSVRNHYEEYTSFQLHNSCQLDCLQKKYKNN